MLLLHQRCVAIPASALRLVLKSTANGSASDVGEPFVAVSVTHRVSSAPSAMVTEGVATSTSAAAVEKVSVHLGLIADATLKLKDNIYVTKLLSI